MPPSQTISPKLPMTNYFTFCYPYDNLFPPFHTWKKKTLYPCPHDKPLQLCHHQKPFLPYNHFTHSTMANYFDHATHDKPFKIFHPWKPWVLFHQDKPFHPCHSSQTISPILSTTYHLSETKKVFHPPYVSLQRRDISRSLLFWQWLGSCRYRFFSPSLLIFLWITQHCI